MKAKSELPDRFKATGIGLGEASQTAIDRRAAELAQIDGRDAFTDQDLERASAELGAQPDSGHDMSTQDEAAEDFGKHTRRTPMENDFSLGEQLTQQGMDDADHDQRVAASDRDGQFN